MELKRSSISALVALILRWLRIICRSSMFCTCPSPFLSMSRSSFLTDSLSPLPSLEESAWPNCRGSVDTSF